MGRLKGLDEMPERTGLEIDWASMPRTRGDDELRGSLSSAQMKIASVILALVIVAIGVYAIGLGMQPTKAQIEAEAQRRQAVLINARNQGDFLEPAIRPGIDGVMVSDQETTREAPGSSFPAGTIEWGEEGRPIGGDLERIEIWDVTTSPQDKVVRIRSGPDMIFATIYLGSGRRTSVMVPAGRAYQVMAMSGDEWKGPVEMFGRDATTVNFGIATIHAGSPGVVAMGAADQPANVVPNDRF
jgi:hypothetical protein